MAPRGGPGLTLRGVRAPHVLLAAVGLLALGVRLVPVLRAGALSGWMSYDEGVHLAVAQRLLDGQVTYREVFFAHPPGVVVAQVPVALLAQAVGEPAALAVSRVVVMCLGALTAILVARLLLPRGLLAAATGGVVVALFGPAVAADRVAMLEPALSIGLVVALTTLARAAAPQPPGPVAGDLSSGQRRALVIGGLALGLAMSVKLWAVLDVVVLAAVVLTRHGWAAARRWCGWTIVGFVVVVGPFALAAPDALWRDVVLAQVSRPRTGGLALGPLSLGTELPSGIRLVALLVVAALAATALVATVRASWRRRAVRLGSWAGSLPDPVWWGTVGVVHLVALMVAPSYYLHYSAFLVVPAALVAGAAVGLVARRVGARARPLVVLAVGLAAAVLVALLPPVAAGARVDREVLAAEADDGCVWVREVAYLIVGGVSWQSIEDDCPGRADLYGERMATATADDPAAALDALDGRVVDELAASRAAFLRAGQPFEGLGPRARGYLKEHFVEGPTTGRIEVWRRAD